MPFSYDPRLYYLNQVKPSSNILYFFFFYKLFVVTLRNTEQNSRKSSQDKVQVCIMWSDSSFLHEFQKSIKENDKCSQSCLLFADSNSFLYARCQYYLQYVSAERNFLPRQISTVITRLLPTLSSLLSFSLYKLFLIPSYRMFRFIARTRFTAGDKRTALQHARLMREDVTILEWSSLASLSSKRDVSN